MVIWAITIYLGPIIIAVYNGWAAAKSPPVTPSEALRAMAIMLGWTAAWVFVFLLAWVGIAIAGVSGFNLSEPLIWFVYTAIFWVPLAIIAYIIRAQKERAS